MNNDPGITKAPWTLEQTTRLNVFQLSRRAYSFTCRKRDNHPWDEGLLVALGDGWICPVGECGYRQDWALAFMTEPDHWPRLARELPEGCVAVPEWENGLLKQSFEEMKLSLLCIRQYLKKIDGETQGALLSMLPESFRSAPSPLTPSSVEDLAREAHANQTDEIGVPYFEHVRSVADGLAPLSPRLEMAGLLHDVIEDTDWTAEALLGIGVPEDVVDIVMAVTKVEGVSYEDMIRSIAKHPDAVLVKIADNAHNSRSDRAAQLPEAKRRKFAERYGQAREILWPAAKKEDIYIILAIVNPDLLSELA